jgi:hypothetical protein
MKKILACVLLLAGCATDGQQPIPRSPSAASNQTFATQLAGPSTFLAPMPTAVVVLKPGDLNRNRAFCQTITARLPTAQQAMAGSVVAPNLILTRWLVQLSDVPAARAADCDFLTGTYDYARAQRLLASVKLQDGSLSGRGPFLLMVVADAAGLHVAGLDGSGYDEASFGRYIDTWGQSLQQTEATVSRQPEQPGLVRSVFNLIAAIFRTAAGVTGGVIRGVVEGV